MKIKSLIVVIALAAGAAWLGACGAPQPHCLVIGSPSGTGYSYWLKYLSSNSTDSCGTIPGENIGFQVYNAPRSNDFSLAWRNDAIGLPLANGVSSTEIDDATTAGNCMEVAGCSGSEDPLANGFATLPAFPTNGICDASAFKAAVQHFDPIPEMDDADGGVISPAVPATTITWAFTKLRFANTTNAPGTVFDGEVDYTQDTCTAHYKVFGFWPAIGCASDEDCDPAADPDAGRSLGSGINPTFKDATHAITCNTTVGVCELAYTSVDDINAIPNN